MRLGQDRAHARVGQEARGDFLQARAGQPGARRSLPARRRARAASSQVASVPATRLSVTARASRLQSPRPNRRSGASQPQAERSIAQPRRRSPKPSASAGTSKAQLQTSTATASPSMTARGGVCGRHTAKPTAGASVASAENETAPMSASASLPAIARL